MCDIACFISLIALPMLIDKGLACVKKLKQNEDSKRNLDPLKSKTKVSYLIFGFSFDSRSFEIVLFDLLESL
jgi:hypothetical protein